MTQKDALRKMVHDGGTTAAWVCERLHFKSKSTLSQAFSRQTVTVDLMIKVANQLGYDLALIPHIKGDKQRSTIILEIKKEEE